MLFLWIALRESTCMVTNECEWWVCGGTVDVCLAIVWMREKRATLPHHLHKVVQDLLLVQKLAISRLQKLKDGATLCVLHHNHQSLLFEKRIKVRDDVWVV